MAGLFVLSGAPDLALTQAAVETLSTVVFVLVLRRLPERFERQSTARRRAVRVAVSAMVGAFVFVSALMAAGVRLDDPVSNEMVARSLPDGHGRNVVRQAADERTLLIAAHLRDLDPAQVEAVRAALPALRSLIDAIAGSP